MTRLAASRNVLWPSTRKRLVRITTRPSGYDKLSGILDDAQGGSQATTVRSESLAHALREGRYLSGGPLDNRSLAVLGKAATVLTVLCRCSRQGDVVKSVSICWLCLYPPTRCDHVVVVK